MQALLAANEDLAGWQQNGLGPLEDLLSFKLESGAFEFTHGGGADLFATVQSVPALMGQPFPVR